MQFHTPNFRMCSRTHSDRRTSPPAPMQAAQRSGCPCRSPAVEPAPVPTSRTPCTPTCRGYRPSAIARWGAIRAEMHKALKRNDRIREYSRKARSRFSAVWTRRSGGSLLSPDPNRKASRRARSPPRAVLWQRGRGCSHRSLLPSNVATKAPPGSPEEAECSLGRPAVGPCQSASW